MKILIIYFFCLCGGLGAVAQPGTPDVNFGQGGLIHTHFSSATCNAIIQKQNRKIITLGYGGTKEKTGFFVAQYNLDGSLDKNFGDSGEAIASAQVLGATGGGDAFSLVIQPNHKIIAAGYFTMPFPRDNDIGIARYNEDGSLDENFGTNGICITDLGFYEYVSDVALQKDGKILVTGASKDYDNGTFPFIARYLEDGNIDESFGINGVIYNGFNSDVLLAPITEQEDGKILVAGTESVRGKTNYLVARYLTTGIRDSSFGTNSIARLFLNGNEGRYSNIADMIIQPDSKILVSGASGESYYMMTVARFNNNGLPDSSFGVNGYAVTPDKKSYSIAKCVMMQDNKKIIISGSSSYTNTRNLTALRFTPEGSVDSSFGENGIAATDISKTIYSSSGALQKDGKILVAGTIYTDKNGYQFLIIRYLGDPTHPLITEIKKWIRKHILNFEDTNPNAAYYVIEKSNDGKGFEEIGSVKSKGQSKPIQKPETRNETYSYPLPSTRNEKPGTNSFRIKTVNKDSSVSYTDAVADDKSDLQINKSTNQQIHIYPNPAKDRIYIQSTKEVNLQLQNNFGQIITTQKIKGGGSIDISKLAVGVYYIVDVDSGEQFKLVKE